MAEAPGSKEQFWLDAWYQGRWWLWLLWPLSLVFQLGTALRRWQQMRAAQPLAAPVIVVGNLTLGGTGKTPLIIALGKYLQQRGRKPGVLSRGYGGEAPAYPYTVTPDSPVQFSGDEPLQIARDSGLPVVVDRDRVAAARCLIEQHGCDILLSDDGLQHYRLQRQLELVVVDGRRGLGNRMCLPAGPLREPPARLQQVDCVVVNGADNADLADLPVPVCVAHLQPVYWCHVKSGQSVELDVRPWPFESGGSDLLAVTGIGNPERFFASVRDLGLEIRENRFPDHHAFTQQDFAFAHDQVVLMTAKDAVKCQSFAAANWWYLAVEMPLPADVRQLIDDFLSDLSG